MFRRNQGWIGFLVLLMALVSACVPSQDLESSEPLPASPQLTVAPGEGGTPAPTGKQKPNKQAMPSPAGTEPAKGKGGKATPVPGAQPQPAAPGSQGDFVATEILGRPADTSVVVNVVPAQELEIYLEYGVQPGIYTQKTQAVKTYQELMEKFPQSDRVRQAKERLAELKVP